MDFNQSISSLIEEEKDRLVISDFNDEVDLPEIPRTCAYGRRFKEFDVDGNILSQQGDWSSCDSDPGSPIFGKEHDSPKKKPSEIIPQSPVFSSRSRRGSRKHQRMRSRRSQDIISLTKPLFCEKSNEDCETAPSVKLDTLDSPFRDDSDLEGHKASVTPGPCRLAASLGCEWEDESPAWVTSLETPGEGRPGPDTVTPEPGHRRLPSKTLFTETARDPQVININRGDLLEMASDEEEAVDKELAVQGCHSVKDSELSLQSKDQQFVGFKTGGGRVIGFSKEALAEAKLKMENISDGQQVDKQSKIFTGEPKKLMCNSEPEVSLSKLSSGFTTGSGKIVTVSDTALRETKRIFDNCTKTVYHTQKLPQNVRDKPANVDISDRARVKFDEHLKSENGTTSFNDKDNEVFDGFKTAKGCKIQISRSAMQKAKEKLGIESQTSKPYEQFIGFKTAKGSKIHISGDALQKAKQRLNVCSNEWTPPNINASMTDKGSKIQISDEPIKHFKERMDPEPSLKIDDTKFPDFEGFKTAKGAKISVSDEALAKAKLKLETERCVKTDTPAQHKPGSMPGFSTAGGGKISISSEALSKVKNMFNDDSLRVPNCPRTPEKIVDNDQVGDFDSEDDKFLLEACSVPEKENIENCGTGDFFTCHPSNEHFRISPFHCGPDFMETVPEQANGFNVPTSNKGCEVSKEINLDVIFGKKRKLEDVEVCNDNSNVSFKREAARRKQKTLIEGKKKRQIRPIPGRLVGKRTIKSQERIKLHDLEMDWSTSPNLSWEAAKHFIFEGGKYFSSESVRKNTAGMSLGDGVLAILSEQGYLSVEELESSFLASPGVDPKLVPNGWFRNHYNWIVWTLSSYQSRLSEKQTFLTPQNVMSRMKYRYDREIDRSERSVLRRVLEKDEPVAVTMVLCVTWISGDKMTLSDGWYHLNSPLYQGSLMQRLVASGKIKVGTKLITQGAEIIGTQAGTPCHPLGRSMKRVTSFEI